ncbi:hypothetical protein JHK85_005785 [Glycine max]|nr:hypothetical protein JHK85_005785 [Glycine max]KAG5081561.1 hypothetical protein JHK86_005626 [Glycine max]KHN38380.1 Pentatricopeptide repeat-containing protein [Glycine soja]
MAKTLLTQHSQTFLLHQSHRSSTHAGPTVHDLVRARNLPGVVAYFGKMKGAGLVADTVIYTILIDGYCRNGNVAEALNVRKEMVERGVFADYYTLTTLFMGRALGLFETLTQRSLVTYNTLMDGFCKIGEMEKAKELWCDMVSRGILPSYVSFSILMNGFCSLGLMGLVVDYANAITGSVYHRKHNPGGCLRSPDIIVEPSCLGGAWIEVIAIMKCSMGDWKLKHSFFLLSSSMRMVTSHHLKPFTMSPSCKQVVLVAMMASLCLTGASAYPTHMGAGRGCGLFSVVEYWDPNSRYGT